MGVQIRVVLFAESEERARAAATAAIARIDALDGVLSDYQVDSETARLVQARGPLRVSADLFDVLERALRFAEATEGAFDPTVGPLVKLWREARRTRVLPDSKALAAALAQVGPENVRLDPEARSVALLGSGTTLDFGGIGKGYALDQAMQAARATGVTRVLFQFGGDILAGEAPPDTSGWKVEIETGATGTVLLENAAVSTSGDTEQFVEIDGVRYSHIVDPKSGLGLTTRSRATVVARDAATADALSTAFCVVGVQGAARLAFRFRGIGVAVDQASGPSFRTPNFPRPARLP